ncbi:ubiquinol-cytochrome c reductase subunit 8, partial [Tremellales sp. Uapishka_1]
MRVTAPAHSGMPSGKAYIGWWGDLGGPKQKGIVQYGILLRFDSRFSMSPSSPRALIPTPASSALPPTPAGLSPFKQRPFAGALHGYLFNGFTRIMSQIPYFAIPFATGYAIYVWGGNKSAYFNSKQGHHDLAGEHAH